MASPLNQDDPQAATANTSAITTTGGAAGTGSSSSASSATPTANQPTGNEQDVSKIGALNQSFDFSPLLNYVQGQGTAARNAISDATNQFNTGLGSAPTFNTDQQNALQSVISGSQPLSAGQSILNTTYSGPSGVDSSKYDPLVQQYVTSAGETQNSNGINTLLGSLRPDLSAGERSYDSLVFGQNPNYQTQSRAIVNDANDVNALGQSTLANGTSAVAQRNSDIGAFNTAANSYVQSQRDQINNLINSEVTQAQQNDQNVQNDLGQLTSGKATFTALPSSDFAFDPNAYQPTDVQSQYGADVFDRVVDPRQYLTYQQGQLPTASLVATPQQIASYNNAEALLNGTDRLQSGGTRTAAQIALDQKALQTALAQAQAARDAADAAWLAAHKPAPPEAPVTTTPVSETNSGGGDVGGDGSGPDGAGGGQDSGGGNADGGGGGQSNGGSNADGGEGMAHTGGLIKNGRVVVKPKGLVDGGYIPPDAGPKGVDTLHGIALNNGEFVVKTPTVADIGPGNLSMLNQVANTSPAHQKMVRDALHAALTGAMR